MAESEADAELEALTSVLTVLAPLEQNARSRVVDYVLRRFGLPSAPVQSGQPPIAPAAPAPTQAGSADVTDIRSLTDQKKPKSAIEMAAVVAYYLAYAAPETEKKAELSASDITKYFHQANFRLPGQASMTLVHAKNAGYIDAGSKRGSYKLNPVGYNLVAHRLPTDATSAGSGRAAPRSRSGRQGGAKRGQPKVRQRKPRKAR
jgi:hypothetical protein